MAGLAQFAGWLATQVFDVVGSVAGQAAAADGGAYSDTVDLQVGKTVYHDVPASVSGDRVLTVWQGFWRRWAARSLMQFSNGRAMPAPVPGHVPNPRPPPSPGPASSHRCAPSCG